MAWIKHASSRNRRKIGRFGTKLRGCHVEMTWDCPTSVTELASFRLDEGSNINNQKGNTS